MPLHSLTKDKVPFHQPPYIYLPFSIGKEKRTKGAMTVFWINPETVNTKNYFFSRKANKTHVYIKTLKYKFITVIRYDRYY